MKLIKWMTVVVSAAMLVAPHTAMGQDWPTGPVKIIVPYAPGSTPDLVARIVADRLQTRLGKPMVVENKAGLPETSGPMPSPRHRPMVKQSASASQVRLASTRCCSSSCRTTLRATLRS